MSTASVKVRGGLRALETALLSERGVINYHTLPATTPRFVLFLLAFHFLLALLSPSISHSSNSIFCLIALEIACPPSVLSLNFLFHFILSCPSVPSSPARFDSNFQSVAPPPYHASLLPSSSHNIPSLPSLSPHATHTRLEHHPYASPSPSRSS